MTREKEIRQASIEYTIKNRPMCIGGGAFSEVVDEMNRNHAFEEGAKWADECPNRNLAYTKQDLKTMGFGFDTNGNIRTPQEIEESHKKHNEYRKNRLINKACQWLLQQEEMIGVSFHEDFIERFKKAMEE